eukprot:TRINITY_DN97705_c0_g1_i1.p1 TRINITY_DN97705_c0_g1~~TRINITY_DN97705_c0_g1_i1.p1  ORF type:complete len:444 (+),score=57.00 TRINITY_DN97705_c0_g1_i1:55-1386(+)
MDATHGDRGSDAERDSDEQLSSTRPISPSLKQETCFVFDWDDTILPTSWLERIHALSGGGPLRPEVQRQLASLCSAAAQTLHLAGTMGGVVIITNSAPGWVDQSCQLFMPQILQLVRSYQIFAKPMHAPLTFKITTFRRECRQFKNLISIGDGDAERAASLRLQAPPEKKSLGAADEPRQRIKSVKLIELPTCQQLIVQHEMLQVRLPDVTAFQGSLDLKSRFPASGASPATGIKAGTPTLVHFGRPPPGSASAATTPGSPMSPRPLDDQPGKGAPMRSALPPALRGTAPGGQLPPLGGRAVLPSSSPMAGGAAEPDFGPIRSRADTAEAVGTSGSPASGGGAAAGQGDGPPSSTGIGGAGAAAANPSEDGLGADNGRDLQGSRGTATGNPGGLWKVQNVGPARDGRAAIFANKKRPVLASVAGMSGRPPGTVWREQPATRGF